MKKITKEIISAHFKEKEVELCSTHHQLSLPIINRIYKKMKSGVKFPSIKVIDNLIIDGHHRYVSSILADYTDLERVKNHKTLATRQYEWSNVNFVEEDWDSEDDINRLNKKDAEYNNISIEQIIEITK